MHARYDAKPTGGTSTKFTVAFTVPDGKIIQVTGVVQGSEIEGKTLWPDDGGEISTSKFRGRRILGQLDGRQYDVEFRLEDEASDGPDSDAEELERTEILEDPPEPVVFPEGLSDRLAFVGGAFESRTSSSQGFILAHFADDEYEGTIRFIASAMSDSHGTLEWTGTAEKEEITGFVVWTRPDGLVMQYSFFGRRVLG
jgi:hypothetical protein